MFRAVRTSLSQMSQAERRHFNLLLVGRSLTAILDIGGVLLIGVIGAIAAGSLASDGGAADGGGASILGVALPFALGTEHLMPLAVIALLFFVLKAVIAILFTKRLTSFVAGVEQRTATVLTERILHGNLSVLETWTKSEITYGITHSMQAAYGRLLSHFATLVTEGFLLLCIALSLLFVSPITMLIVVLYFGAIGYFIQVFVGKRQQSAGLALADSTVKATDSMTETIGAFREIFTLGRQEHFVARFGAARKRMAESAGAVQFVMTLPRYIVESALMLGAVALIAFQLLSSDLTTAAATLGIFLTAGFRIMASLLPLQSAAGSISQVSSEAELAHGLLAGYPPVSIPRRQREHPESASGFAVQIRDASFTYEGASNPALQKISFTAHPGEYCAIIGASGAGKSTLADLLLGLIEPSGGAISLGGATPRELDENRPGSIAYVPQRPGLVSGSIAENVALGIAHENIDVARVTWALSQANLLNYVDSLPEGMMTSVGKQTSALSGGQIQRLGLARALYVQPQLLVLDEATSALDAESESVVGDSLRKLHGTVTLVVIAHRLSTVQHADTVHVMEDGRIIAAGPFTHLLETVPLVARYAELMALDANP